MTGPSGARWRNTFLGAVIALNVMIFLREPARASGIVWYVLWSAVVLGIGASMLRSIYQLRQMRLNAAARRTSQPSGGVPPGPIPESAEGPPRESRSARRRRLRKGR